MLCSMANRVMLVSDGRASHPVVVCAYQRRSRARLEAESLVLWHQINGLRLNAQEICFQ
jgi:hypothetical protein